MENDTTKSAIKTVPCRFCGWMVSPRAKVCPHCGDPINCGNGRHAFTVGIAGIIVFPMIILCALLFLGAIASGQSDKFFHALVVFLLALSIFGRR